MSMDIIPYSWLKLLQRPMKIFDRKLLAEVEDDKERFAILNHYLDGFRGTVFRQTQFAEFEQAIYKADQEGQVLTADFNELYGQTNENTTGFLQKKIQKSSLSGLVFHTSIIISMSISMRQVSQQHLANKIVNGSPEDKENYLNYLKAGSSDYSSMSSLRLA